jgi:hypothetical protein
MGIKLVEQIVAKPIPECRIDAGSVGLHEASLLRWEPVHRRYSFPENLSEGEAKFDKTNLSGTGTAIIINLRPKLSNLG